MDAYSDRKIYRNRINAKDLVFYRVSYRETDLFIGSKSDLSDIILPDVKEFRTALDAHIDDNPQFKSALKPLIAKSANHSMIGKMYEASGLAGVGPMATVAGAFCQTVFEAVKNDTDALIVENGGDLLVWSKVPRTIALYAGDSPLSMKLGLALKEADPPLGICASAGTFGHSLSFGNADMALCVSENVLLADACATRLGNAVKAKADLKPAIEEIFSVFGIKGAVAILGDQMAAIGSLNLKPIDNSL